MDSYVEYRRARTIEGAHIQKCVAGWEYVIKDPMPAALLQRVCDGIKLSKFVPRRILDYFLANAPP
jgi:hypothetical protein